MSDIEGSFFSEAVYLSKKMYENSDSVTSTLCYGVQWDEMCRYIGDYTRTGSTSDGLNVTGRAMGEDVSKNIYDLAGNCFEWTMEHGINEYSRIQRGGDYKNSYAISKRISRSVNFDPASSAEYNYSFRCALYIK